MRQAKTNGRAIQVADANIIKNIALSCAMLAALSACSSDIGGNEDRTKPVATLTSLNNGEEVIGNYTVTWQTDETNPSTVDIYTSNDSALTWSLLEIDHPDTGSFDWDSNSIDDCRTCRIRIIPKDVVGNIGEAADSNTDFIVNNIPNLLNIALFYDIDNDGINAGDKIIVQFDKDVETFTSNGNDLDIISGNEDSADKIWLNNSNGLFTDSGQSLGIDSTFAITTGDVDGDLDIIAGIKGGSDKLWLNNGAAFLPLLIKYFLTT